MTTHLLSNRCALSLLNLVSSIVLDVNLKQQCNDYLSNFLFNLADNRISADIDFGLSLANFLVEISDRSTTSVVFLKNLAMDYSNIRYLDYTDENEADKESIDEKTAQFNFFNCSHSFIRYQLFVNKKITYLLAHFKWCMSKLSTLDPSVLIFAINTQIDSLVLVINYFIKSVFDSETAKACFELMNEFYQFMSFYIKSVILSLLVLRDFVNCLIF